ncbi:MAG: cisplatin damage response ATP-dependent DNA ligase [Sphingobacteriales bacterium]|nr:MAG: cisplatin damage response ATP-dependent DNA ligase [Sphingobacteriales bacterium]
MDNFAALLDRLYFTHGNLAKAELLLAYLRQTPDPERGYAVAILAGALTFDLFKRHTIREVTEERVDPHLLALSRDYVGETSETVAHIWPVPADAAKLEVLPSLGEIIDHFTHASKQEVRDYLVLLLDNMTTGQRWALLKLGTQGLRVGVSARFIKQVLATYGSKDVSEIETLWHGLTPPYTDLFAWLENRGEAPIIEDRATFHPVMLSHPLEDRDLAGINTADFAAEWKYDGIRVQLVSASQGRALFTRTGDDISDTFSDLLADVDFQAVLDGELLVRHGPDIGTFNDLQQRLNKKQPTPKLMETHPAFMMVYDILEANGENYRGLPLMERRKKLEAWHQQYASARFDVSALLAFESVEALQQMRAEAEGETGHYIEGVMLKKWSSPYLGGRPKGHWYKWKRDALLVDAVLMYAQRGSGKRSSFYSDYTFGLWKDGQLLPVGKAYSGFTDEELKKLDAWIRKHTTARFGPVREVEKSLVFELAFDSVHVSNRHKSGYALRFPRVNRIRWDKPAGEADTMDALEKLVRGTGEIA